MGDTKNKLKSFIYSYTRVRGEELEFFNYLDNIEKQNQDLRNQVEELKKASFINERYELREAFRDALRLIEMAFYGKLSPRYNAFKEKHSKLIKESEK